MAAPEGARNGSTSRRRFCRGTSTARLDPHPPILPRPALVVAEALAGLAAEAPGGDEVLEQRRGREPRLAEFLIQLALDRQRDIEADDVEELEGPHRVAAADLHGRVDVISRRVVRLEHLDRVVEVGEEQGIDDEARAVAAPDG